MYFILIDKASTAKIKLMFYSCKTNYADEKMVTASVKIDARLAESDRYVTSEIKH